MVTLTLILVTFDLYLVTWVNKSLDAEKNAEEEE